DVALELRGQGRAMQPRRRTGEGQIGPGGAAQLGLEVPRRLQGVLARDQPAINLDAAEVGHGVDAQPALDAADAQRGRAEQRIGTAAANLLGIALDVAEQPAHAVDRVDALLWPRTVARAARRGCVPSHHALVREDYLKLRWLGDDGAIDAQPLGEAL